MRCIYVAHRLGSGPLREANRTAAAEWAGWVAKTFRVAISADWIVLSGQWQETPENRALGLETDLEMVRRSDGLWLLGPVVSPGMQLEAEQAARWGKPVLDFTGMDREQIVRAAGAVGFLLDVAETARRAVG